ncbi:MAG: hypothetical protein SH850_18450 [Planctomycetaceae bacterium]|nr:hypothetical protein [Planctomycetaceae bacterium]
MKIVGDKTEKSVAARKALSPASLNRGRVPSWVKVRIKLAISRGELNDCDHPLLAASTALDHLCRQIGSDWLDHYGSYKDVDGHDFLVSEPYSEKISPLMLTQLTSIAKILGVKYCFDSNSEWYPGRTVRIWILPA